MQTVSTQDALMDQFNHTQRPPLDVETQLDRLHLIWEYLDIFRSKCYTSANQTSISVGITKLKRTVFSNIVLLRNVDAYVCKNLFNKLIQKKNFILLWSHVWMASLITVGVKYLFYLTNNDSKFKKKHILQSKQLQDFCFL